MPGSERHGRSRRKGRGRKRRKEEVGVARDDAWREEREGEGKKRAMDDHAERSMDLAPDQRVESETFFNL